MKPSVKLFLLAAALGLWASAASAHHILGRVVCIDTTPPTQLGGVPVTITGALGSSFTTTTAGDGLFVQFLPVVTDTYTVAITPPAGMAITSPASGQYVVMIFANGVGGPDNFEGANFELRGCQPPPLGTIGDTVFCDANANGIQDAGEAGIPGVKVTLVCKDAAGAIIASAMVITDANGKYLFVDVPAGSCEVTVDVSTVPPPCNVPVCAPSVDHTLGAGEIFLDADFCFTEPPSCPACVDPVLGLGAAAGCTVLQLGAAKVSVTGPAGGIIGDICMGANSSLSMSGDNYVTGTVKLAPGAKISNSSHSPVNVLTNVDLSAEVSAALNRAATAAALPPSQTFTTLDGKTVTMINGVAGLNVVQVKDISLSGKQIYLNGPVGAKFILNVTGKFTLTGGGAGPQIRATGGVLPKDILYNIIGTGPDVAFSGGGGGVDCCQAVVDGTLLAPSRKINLSPGLVNGQVISGMDISIVSGSGVHCPPCP
jgi:choice-of-anchor A domain-containing protein